MYASLRLPWSTNPTVAESTYRSTNLIKTKGTIFLLPPSPTTLRQTFNAPPRPKTRMSSGAVALCKHFERSGGSIEHRTDHPFWKLPEGSNEKKNLIAEKVLEDMLRNAVWKNVMLLHAGVAVYEIRNPRGYGMRWTLDVKEEEAERDRELEEADGINCVGDSSSNNVPKTINSHDGEEKKLIPPSSPASPTPDTDETTKNWTIMKTTFRGFLEPIEGLDHELALSD